MQALRLNEVLTRVVAWHNRHPLARRIRAHQVHSVGEVVLPFASASARAAAPTPAPPAAPNAPSMDDLLVPSATALTDLHAPAESDPTGAGLADATAVPAPEPGRADPAGGLDADPGARPSPPSEASAIDNAAPEPAPALSMEDEADDLFSSNPQAVPAAPDERGPEMLIELPTDPAEPLDAAPAESSAQPSDDGAADPTPGFGTIDADSATPAAADAADVPAPHTATGNLAYPTPPDDSTGRPASGASIDPAIATAQAGAAAADSARSAVPQPQARAAPPATSGLLERLLAPLKRWRNATGAERLPRLRPTFSRDFIWPLRPGQVARWARRHGSLAPLAPADWPQRLIDIDVKLQAQAWRDGLPHALPLHVLTAAIGVGDRRIRVLIDGRGHILGPRSYSPPRLATLASLVALGLLGAAWGWLPGGDSRGPQQASAALATAAAAASAALPAALPAAQSAARAASAADEAAALASDAQKMALAQQAGPMSAHPAPAAAPPGEAVPVAHEAASAPDHTLPPAQQPTAAMLGHILPVLSPAAKRSARLQAEALRSSQATAIAAQPPPRAGPVFAIVTRPTREKDSAARSLALIRASGQRLRGEVPEQGELMLNQGQWRAAWWPFENQADAERARVMLAARGLYVEVVEF